MKTELFDVEVLRSLDNMEVSIAKVTAQDLINKMNKKSMKQATVINRLIHDIDKAHTSVEVSRIMWQVYMSGSGYGTIGSTWKKHYDSI
jgi:hypothetical protein